MSRAPRIERPRGTHDVIPSEQPLWRRVTSEIERLCALYGYRPITTPVFEDTALFERTSGAGSDVVQKEMYTFSDRSDRSLTLRPEATAPICRAYVEHGLHREPQPAKLFTIASMYRYGAPGKGRYREHWQASVEAIGSDDPSVDAELIQLYDALLGRLGVTQYHLDVNSIGCRECRPAYLEALRAWLGRTSSGSTRRRARRPRRARCASSTTTQAKPEAVRAALDEAPTIGESLCAACVERFAVVRATSTRPASRTARADARPRARLLLAHDLGVRRPARERERDALGRRPLRLPRRGDRGPPTPGVGLRRRDRAAAPRAGGRRRRRGERPRSTSSSPWTEVPARASRGWLAELRARGVACDTDYAGRSLKGQLTQAGRSGASTVVVVGADGATIRRAGRPDEPVTHDELLGRLSPMTWRDVMCGDPRPSTSGRR